VSTLRTRTAVRPFDPAELARRLTVAIAAGTGLAGLLFGRPLLATTIRAGAVLVLGLCVCAVLGRIARRAPRGGGVG
jgi:hypothetical protein